MGYGRRAMNLLIQYYEGKIPSLSEEGVEDKTISTLTGDEVNIDRLWLSLRIGPAVRFPFNCNSKYAECI